MYKSRQIECDYCHKTIKGDARDAHLKGWDWATGLDDKTKHACNDCVAKPDWNIDKTAIKVEQLRRDLEIKSERR